MDILKKIEQYREEEQRLKWEGTFAEYLEIVKENPLSRNQLIPAFTI